MALVDYEHALGRVLERIRALPGTTKLQVAPLDAVGLVAASDVTAGDPVPPFDNSAVDGFAVRAADVTSAPVDLEVVATVAAGTDPGVELAAGECARIMTGAVVPHGADAVVMVEDTELVDEAGPGTPRRVRVKRSAVAGDHVRPLGDDLPAGAVGIPAGTELRPAHVGLLATLGRTRVEVRAAPRVGVLSTGDELVEPGRRIGPGQIRDSNRQMLLSLCTAAGFDPVDLGLVADEEAAIERVLQQGASRCDALITSGGVSMGDFDYVKAVLGRIADMDWMQVAIKPAKPFAFGTIGRTPVFGLPGNPVSSLVSFELFARPGLRMLSGHTCTRRVPVTAVAGEDLRRRRDGKVHFVRVWLTNEDGTLLARTTGGQGSHQLAASAAAQGLAVVPDGEGLGRGSRVEVLLLDPAP